MIETVVMLLFALIAFIWIVDSLVPGWRAQEWGFAVTLGGLVRLVIGLVVIWIVYLIVMAILGGMHLP